MTELDGHRLLAEGREAEIYEWGAGRVLRLMRDSAQRPGMERSTIAIEAAVAAGVATPAVIDHVEVDGRPGQVMERVDGTDQFAVVAAKPWRMVALARALGRIHADLHRTTVPDRYLSVHDHVREHLASERVPTDIAEAAAAALEGLPDGSAICHGDYHPGNVLETDAGPVVIDWTNAARGEPMADVARTRLMLRIGEVPPGAPVVVRVAAATARSLFGRLYVQAYAKAGELDVDLCDRWEPVRAADRLAEGIEEEREKLLVICREGLL